MCSGSQICKFDWNDHHSCCWATMSDSDGGSAERSSEEGGSPEQRGTKRAAAATEGSSAGKKVRKAGVVKKSNVVRDIINGIVREETVALMSTAFAAVRAAVVVGEDGDLSSSHSSNQAETSTTPLQVVAVHTFLATVSGPAILSSVFEGNQQAYDDYLNVIRLFTKNSTNHAITPQDFRFAIVSTPVFGRSRISTSH